MFEGRPLPRVSGVAKRIPEENAESTDVELSLSQLDMDVAKHNADSTNTFRKFSEILKPSIAPTIFAIFRDNYIVRTESTYRSICQTLGSAMAEPRVSPYTLMALRDTIREELGHKYGTDTHQNLMFNAFSTHGVSAFGLKEASFAKVLQSSFVTDATFDFRLSQSKVYGSADHGVVLGAFFAQESAAETMLNLIRITYFTPFYENYVDRSLIPSVEMYFNAHLDGTEMEHASRSRLCVEEYLKFGGSFSSVHYGASTILNKQKKLWTSLFEKMATL